MKLLLVEDDGVTIDAIRLCMEVYEPSSTVISTSSGQDAIDLLTKGEFDVVVLDLGLPDLDGFEVLKRIRLLGNTPVLVCSARRNIELIASAMKLGADDYIIKPFEFRILLDSLHRVVGHRPQ